MQRNQNLIKLVNEGLGLKLIGRSFNLQININNQKLTLGEKSAPKCVIPAYKAEDKHKFNIPAQALNQCQSNLISPEWPGNRCRGVAARKVLNGKRSLFG